MARHRDLVGIETREGARGSQRFRAYVADPARPGRKLTGTWGTYEQALEWRRRAVAIKAEAKRRAQGKRTEGALASLERSLLERDQAG
jgi:hypothetical protein